MHFGYANSEKTIKKYFESFVTIHKQSDIADRVRKGINFICILSNLLFYSFQKGSKVIAKRERNKEKGKNANNCANFKLNF